MKYIGIDIGFINCCVGIYRSNTVEIISDIYSGDMLVPFEISFYEKKILVGISTKNLMKRNPKNTIYGIRKLLGKKFNDPQVQNFMKTVPYKIEKDLNSDKINIVVKCEGEIKKYFPEDLYIMILQKLKYNAESYYGDEIKNVVLTVPTYFNEKQFELIENACKIVGFKDIKLIYEPIAACIAYNKLNDERNILVFSMGSNELDISIIELKNKKFKILGTSHDDFGGDDFTNLLLQYNINKFKEYTNIDISNNKKAIERLREECEKAKCALSWVNECIIGIDCLANGEDYCINIHRLDFDYLCEDLFDKCIFHIKKALESSKLKESDIDNIILARGSSRIPKIKEIIEDYFQGHPYFNLDINPEEIYAYGATIGGALINNELGTNLSFEIDNIKDIFIPRNEKIPCKREIDETEIKKI
jgi:molecular chaperone DnaK (HSP70)